MPGAGAVFSSDGSEAHYCHPLIGRSGDFHRVHRHRLAVTVKGMGGAMPHYRFYTLTEGVFEKFLFVGVGAAV
jgi:hypothetical protein